MHIVNTARDRDWGAAGGQTSWLAGCSTACKNTTSHQHSCAITSLAVHTQTHARKAEHALHTLLAAAPTSRPSKWQGASACASVPQHQHSCTHKHRSPPAQLSSSMTVALPTHMVTVATAYLKSQRNYYLTYTYSAAAVSQSRRQPCGFCTPTHLTPEGLQVCAGDALAVPETPTNIPTYTTAAPGCR